MTATEFSNQFDLLFNNISSNQAPGLNEYEKSVFLTKAQDEIVKNYFQAESNGNTTKKGFDSTAIRQSDFSSLIRTRTLEASPNEAPLTDPRAIVYKESYDKNNRNNKILIVINEQLFLQSVVYAKDIIDGTSSVVSVSTDGIRQVIPITYSEYMRLMSKPFKEPLKWQAWRLLSDGDNDTFRAEIVTTSADKAKYKRLNSRIVYNIRYVKKPVPIILTDLSDAFGERLQIDGFTTPDKGTNANGKVYTGVDGCELPEILHEQILQRAVELAKIAWAGNPNDIQLEVEAGKRSE